MLVQRPSETNRLYLKRLLKSGASDEDVIKIVRALGDEAAPWLIEWYVYKSSYKLKMRAFAALTSLPREAVSPHLLAFLHSHPSLSEKETIQVLNLADSLQVVSVPVSILSINRKEKKPLANSATLHAARSLCEYGSHHHTALIQTEIHAILPKVNFTPRYWFTTLSWYGLGLILFTCYALPILAAFGYKRITRTQRLIDDTHYLLLKASDAFAQWKSFESIGTLAICASSRLKDVHCLQALLTLLEQLGPGNEHLLQGDELYAMHALLNGQIRDKEKLAMIRSAPYWGNESTLSWMKRALYEPLPAELKQAIMDTLPLLDQRLNARREHQMLMRAVDLQDKETLLRAPEQNPEIPSEQLLRIAKADEETPQQ